MRHDLGSHPRRDERIDVRSDVQGDQPGARVDASFRGQHRGPEEACGTGDDPDPAALPFVHRERPAGQQGTQGLRIGHFGGRRLGSAAEMQAGQREHGQAAHEGRGGIRQEARLGKPDRDRAIRRDRIGIRGARIRVQAGGKIDGKDAGVAERPDSIDGQGRVRDRGAETARRPNSEQPIEDGGGTPVGQPPKIGFFGAERNTPGLKLVKLPGGQLRPRSDPIPPKLRPEPGADGI